MGNDVFIFGQLYVLIKILLPWKERKKIFRGNPVSPKTEVYPGVSFWIIITVDVKGFYLGNLSLLHLSKWRISIKRPYNFHQFQMRY